MILSADLPCCGPPGDVDDLLPLALLQLSQWQSTAPLSVPVNEISTWPQLHVDDLLVCGIDCFDIFADLVQIGFVANSTSGIIM
jgi:hypothetical protein